MTSPFAPGEPETELVLIPVALYLAERLRPSVGIAEAHLSLCAAARPPALVACYVLGRPAHTRPWHFLILLALVQSGGVSLAVLVLHRLCLRRAPLMVVPAETRRRALYLDHAGAAVWYAVANVPAYGKQLVAKITVLNELDDLIVQMQRQQEKLEQEEVAIAAQAHGGEGGGPESAGSSAHLDPLQEAARALVGRRDWG